jgi:hypothetical protein
LSFRPNGPDRNQRELHRQVTVPTRLARHRRGVLVLSSWTAIGTSDQRSTTNSKAHTGADNVARYRYETKSASNQKFGSRFGAGFIMTSHERQLRVAVCR